MKQFNVTLDKELFEQFESVLEKQGKTKTSWLKEKIQEELNKKKE